MISSNKTSSVSLIIVTYNAAEFITDCLISIREQSYHGFETIIVDNASKDNTVEIIEKYFPWVILIKSLNNLGFAGGVELGYSHSQGKYIALLNPDTIANKSWLDCLISIMEDDEKCGICASLMLQWGTELVDTAGDGCTRAGKGFKIGNNEPSILHNKSKEVFAACGGAALYRRKMLEQIGFFDLDFFLLHEDTDLCFRARLAGWNCMYVHSAVVDHKVSASIGYKSALAVYHSVKNSDMVWLKNMPGILMFLTLPEKMISDVAYFIYLGIIHKKYREYIRAKYYVITHLLDIIKKRKKIKEQRAITNQELFKLLTPFLSIGYILSLFKEKKHELNKFLGRGS
jgi:GT2 family glycosyltransferase